MFFEYSTLFISFITALSAVVGLTWSHRVGKLYNLEPEDLEHKLGQFGTVEKAYILFGFFRIPFSLFLLLSPWQRVIYYGVFLLSVSIIRLIAKKRTPLKEDKIALVLNIILFFISVDVIRSCIYSILMYN